MIQAAAARQTPRPGSADFRRNYSTSKRLPPSPVEAADGVLGAVGRTPTARLQRLTCGRDLRVFAKLEFCNPGGSMKDRPAARMVQSAIASGELRAGMTVVESSSGNMAVGLAQACAYYGLKFRCVADVRTQAANVRLMRAYGADVEVIESPDRDTGDFLTARLNRVRQFVSEDPEGHYWTNQYGNPENPAAHAAGTVRQLLEESGGLDVLMIATSTTGTLNGAIDCCERFAPLTRVMAVDAAGSVLFEGSAGTRAISGLGAGTVPPLARAVAPAGVFRVSDLDCVVGCRTLVRAEGLLAGGSSGGLVTALSRLAPTLPAGCRVGLVLPDHGSRYLETVYEDDWVAEVAGCDADQLRGRVASLTAAVTAPRHATAAEHRPDASGCDGLRRTPATRRPAAAVSP